MDYLATLKDLEKYYANTLIVQYNGLPKASATIKLFVDLVFGAMLIKQVQDAFNWKTAKGVQLDVIGKWVGVSRNYNGSLFWNKTYLSYPSWNKLTPADNTDVLQHGYSDYNSFDTETGNTLTYNDLSFINQDLDDDKYRVVIGLKIIKNNLVHNCKNIDDAIALYFAEKDENGNVIYDEDGYIANPLVYTTWDDHEIIYHYDPSLSTIINVCNYKNVLPAPTGVKISLSQIS